MQTYIDATSSKEALMRESPEEIIRIHSEIEDGIRKVRGRANIYESVMTDIETHLNLIKGLSVPQSKKGKKKLASKKFIDTSKQKPDMLQASTSRI